MASPALFIAALLVAAAFVSAASLSGIPAPTGRAFVGACTNPDAHSSNSFFYGQGDGSAWDNVPGKAVEKCFTVDPDGTYRPANPPCTAATNPEVKRLIEDAAGVAIVNCNGQLLPQYAAAKAAADKKVAECAAAACNPSGPFNDPDPMSCPLDKETQCTIAFSQSLAGSGYVYVKATCNTDVVTGHVWAACDAFQLNLGEDKPLWPLPKEPTARR